MLGIAIGPLFPLTMTLPLDATDRPAEVASLAGMMLGVGYTLSATAPLLLGVIRDATGGFTAVLWTLVGLAALLVVVDCDVQPRAPAGSGVDVDRDDLGVELDRGAALLVRAVAAALMPPNGTCTSAPAVCELTCSSPACASFWKRVEVARLDVKIDAREAKRHRVRARERLVEVAEAVEARHRAEHLLAGEERVVAHALEHRRRDEVRLVVCALAAGERSRRPRCGRARSRR